MRRQVSRQHGQLLRDRQGRRKGRDRQERAQRATLSPQEGELRTRYLRHRQHGLHHLPAVTAVALKLARIVWRSLKEQRDYRPEGRPTQP